jgi:hypothetical protein
MKEMKKLMSIKKSTSAVNFHLLMLLMMGECMDNQKT